MATVIVLVALCLAAVAAVPTNPQRIVGGELTTIEVYPYMVSLLYTANGITYWQNCGGSLITNVAVLTAAHCPFGDAATRWRARVGSTFANSHGVVHNFESVVIHPGYGTGYGMNHDIAIMRTATAVVYTDVIQPASIAGSNYNVGDNQEVWATGWGTTSYLGPASEQLRHVQVWTINQEECVARYGSESLTDNMLCSGWLDVGGRDQCQGDSGGPLFHPNNNINVVIGICSWGRGCASAEFPGVNTRVSRYTDWILANA